MDGPLSLHTEEHRYFADLARFARANRLAFFTVVDVVCVGSFCGAEQSVLDPGACTPFMYDDRHMRHTSVFREDVVAMDCAAWQNLPCSSASVHGSSRSLGSVADVLQRWAARQNLPLRLT
eukprot:9175174-Alexandrium_andersonii.AAC.1